MSGKAATLLMLVVGSAVSVAAGCSPTAPATTAASTTALPFPGHLPGARALSTYTQATARSAAWESSASTDQWVLRSACTSRQAGATLRFEVSRARSGPVEEEEQLAVGSGDVVCDGAAHDSDLGKVKPGRLAIEIAIDDHTLRAYAIVVPKPG